MTDVDVGSDDSARSDAELILDVRGGDLEAYGALYVRHVPAARAVARQYVRSAADADDVVSEAFHRVLDVLQHGGGPDATFRAYLLTVVRHLAADLARGVRRTRPTADDGTFEAALGFVDSTDVATFEGFEHSVVKSAYQALPERWQAVLWYTEIEGRTPAEVAPILGLTPNGVSALAYRAREGLRVGYLQEHLTYAPTDGCRAINPLLGGYVRGGLARREVAKVDAHLGDCGECRSLVLELSDIAHGMRAVVAPLIVGLAGMAVVGALPIGGSIVGALGGAAAGGGAVGSGVATGSATSVGTVTGGTAGSTMGGATASIGTTATTTATTAATTTATTAATTTATTGAASLAGTATAGVASGSAATAASATTAAAAGAFMGTSAGVAAAAGAVAVATVGVVTVLNALNTPQDPPAAPPAAVTIPGDPWAAPWEPPVEAEVEPGEDAVDTPADPTADPTSPVNLLAVSPFPPLADLTVASATGPLEPRTVQSLVLTVTNTGGASADGSMVEVTLPDGVDLALPDAPLGTSAGSAFAADALACTPVDGGGRLARCALGTIEPGASRTGSVPVRAGSGGTYVIGASVWADNLAAETVHLPPTTVLPYGAELTASTGDAVVLSNPGAAWVPLAVRNTGDQPAPAGWSVLVTVPDGLRPVTSDGDLTCSPAAGGGGASTSSDGSTSTGGATTVTTAVLTTTGSTTGATTTAGASSGTSWSCASGAGAAPLGPGEQRSVRVRVVADGTFAPGTTSVTAAPQLPGSSHALPGRTAVDVAQPWAGASGGVRSVQARCAAVGGVTTASAVVEATYVNLTDQSLGVRLDAAGSSGTAGQQVAPGESVTVRVPDGLRVPAGGASWTLSTTLGGETYRTSVAAGPHSSAECYDPRWDTSTSAETVNVDGRLQVRGTLTNTSDEAMRVGMTAAGGSADQKRVAPGESATFVVPTDRTTLGAAAAEFQLYRWVADADGDEPQQGVVPAAPPTARYASAVLAPAAGGPAQLTAGECAYDADTETSRRTVTVPLDNTASTHAVRFAVTGGLGGARSAVVEAGQSGTLEVPVAWGTRGVTLTADGRELATVDVPAFEGCATLSWPDATVDVTTAARCVDDRAQVAVEVRNRGNVPWEASLTGGGDGSVVQPGSSATLVARTGGLEADAGAVTVRLERTIEDRRPAAERTVSYDTVSCVVVAPQARLDLGDVQVDKHRWRSTSTRAATVVLDNSGSSVPVDFRVTGTNGVTHETTVGARQSASVDGGTVTGRTGATFTVSAGDWSTALSVDPFTGTTGWCASPLRWRGDHEVGEVASWRGSNYRYVGKQGWDGGSGDGHGAAQGNGVAQGQGVASTQGHGRWFGHEGRFRGWERIGACERGPAG